MPRVSAFYGIVIYMYWNEADHQVAYSTPTMAASAHRYRWMASFWLDGWSPEPWPSFRSGRNSIVPSFRPTGNGLVAWRPSSPSRPCRSIGP